MLAEILVPSGGESRTKRPSGFDDPNRQAREAQKHRLRLRQSLGTAPTNCRTAHERFELFILRMTFASCEAQCL